MPCVHSTINHTLQKSPNLAIIVSSYLATQCSSLFLFLIVGVSDSLLLPHFVVCFVKCSVGNRLASLLYVSTLISKIFMLQMQHIDLRVYVVFFYCFAVQSEQ